MSPIFIEKSYNNMKAIGAKIRDHNYNKWASKVKGLVVPAAVIFMPFVIVPFAYFILSNEKYSNYSKISKGDNLKDLFDENPANIDH